MQNLLRHGGGTCITGLRQPAAILACDIPLFYKAASSTSGVSELWHYKIWRGSLVEQTFLIDNNNK
jgi:hypothetical protein